MILIAHRGNINGPNKELENKPSYILEAIRAGFEVEIDVWYIDGEFYLGHDGPANLVSSYFIKQPSLWCHAKNQSALIELSMLKAKHFFWHQEDDLTLTSCGKAWVYPGKMNNEIKKIGIHVMPEIVMSNVTLIDRDIYGVCSDYVGVLK